MILLLERVLHALFYIMLQIIVFILSSIPNYFVKYEILFLNIHVRGLLFKFVDFLYNRSEVFDRVLKVISSETIFFSLPFDV